jgi:hypothetical protein
VLVAREHDPPFGASHGEPLDITDVVTKAVLVPDDGQAVCAQLLRQVISVDRAIEKKNTLLKRLRG